MRQGPWQDLPRGRRETIVLLLRRGYTAIGGTRSGTVGQPTVPDFSQKVKKLAMKSLNLESGPNIFAKKGKKSEKIELRQSPSVVLSFWCSGMHLRNKASPF